MLNPYGTWTLFKRETKRYLKVYLQTILSPLVSNLLYLAVFGISLHKSLPDVQGVSYLAFLVPGLVAMGVSNNAFQNPSSSLIIAKYSGIITDLLTIPLKRAEIMVAILGSAIIRGLLVGAVTLLTFAFFVKLSIFSVAIAIGSAVLVSWFFAALGLFVGIWATEFDNVALVQSFILTPLTFLGGVFYPIQNLPPFFENFSRINPIVYMIDLIRYGFTGISIVNPWISLLIVGGLTVFITVVTHLVLRAGWKLQT